MANRSAPVLRGRTLVLAAAVLAAVCIGGSAAVVSAGGGFTDVGPSHPFRNEILAIRDAGITTGFDDGSYRPGQPVSRGAMAAFMGRGFGRAAEATGMGTLTPGGGVVTIASTQLAAGATEQGGGYVLVTASLNYSVANEATCPCSVGMILTDGVETRNSTLTVLSDDDVLTPPGVAIGSTSGSALFAIPADQLRTFSVRALSSDADATIEVTGNVTALYVPFDGLGNAPVV